MNKNDKDPVKESITTLIDLSSDRFPEVTHDKNTSLVVLGYKGKDLVLEITSYDPRIRKYILEHVTVSIVKKHKLISEDEIELFEPYVPNNIKEVG